jgi:hypothetical protein
MFETMTDMFMNTVLVLGIGFALIIRLATRHPQHASPQVGVPGTEAQPFRFLVSHFREG